MNMVYCYDVKIFGGVGVVNSKTPIYLLSIKGNIVIIQEFLSYFNFTFFIIINTTTLQTHSTNSSLLSFNSINDNIENGIKSNSNSNRNSTSNSNCNSNSNSNCNSNSNIVLMHFKETPIAYIYAGYASLKPKNDGNYPTFKFSDITHYYSGDDGLLEN
ncbi:hypothetical protein ACTFIZ_005434 [Dictyostelium cf. discoideum]